MDDSRSISQEFERELKSYGQTWYDQPERWDRPTYCRCKEPQPDEFRYCNLCGNLVRWKDTSEKWKTEQRERMNREYDILTERDDDGTVRSIGFKRKGGK